MSTLKKYLYPAFRNAVLAAFPEMSDVPAPLLYKPRYGSNDLSSSVALKIATYNKQSNADSIAETVLNHFEWDEYFLDKPCKEHLIDKGYINFRFNTRYLLESVCSPTPVSRVCFPPQFDQKHISVYSKIYDIYLYAERCGFYKQKFDISIAFSYLHALERQLMVELAASDFSEIFSGKLFFIRQILILTQKYYRSVPVSSPDSELTIFRMFLIKQVIHKINTLWACAGF